MGSGEPRRPLSIRTSTAEARRDYDGPHDGVPAWLHGPLSRWIASFFSGSPPHDRPFLDTIGLRLRVRIPWNGTTYLGGVPVSLVELTLENEQFHLDLIDMLLEFSNGLNRAELRTLLSDGGSVWTVSQDEPWQLERRVSPELAEVRSLAQAGDDPAATHIRNAWGAAFGRAPDGSAAYRSAVAAVEAALKPLVSPNDATATLGKMIGEMKANPGPYQVLLHRTSPPGNSDDPVGAVRGMLELLWHSQTDRHGTDDRAVPPSVSIEEARAAVALATLVVHWVKSGVLTSAQRP